MLAGYKELPQEITKENARENLIHTLYFVVYI